ncbi:hypothetical protein V9T40_013361 [Parthenolecanium corni]|uniref:Uncharacterized protein n=1 Tax=Parthenolecanium corni TaxID=536013 RepID=A0AAN9TL60_9HEMI
MTSQQNVQNSIAFLFDRPGEPLLTGRDDVSFDVPENFWPDRYKAIASSIQSRFPVTGRVIRVQNIQVPDITEATTLGRHENFSLFNPAHRKCSNKLIETFMGMSNIDQFFSACVYARERVNPHMFVYAASVALLHRNDTRHIPIPPNCEVLPELYVDGSIFARAKEEVGVIPSGSRLPIEVPLDLTASDLDVEHRVAYWREDVGINLHHWHWHLVYPFDGPQNIVRKDRRGELFYYMHQQINARYNFERLSNGLSRVRRLNNFRDQIPEGYYPKLDSTIASRVWPARQANSVMRDLNRESDQLSADVQDLERWRDRILNDIFDGSVRDTSGRSVPLTEEAGIDILGNIIEASLLSVNRNRYGDLHNFGHLMLAYIHDPDNRYQETFGVMGDPTTAMRDPIFYAWHAYMGDIFQEYKGTLIPYTTQQLEFDGIRVTGAEITVEGGRVNEFATFWQQDDIDLSRGLDFQPRGSVFARLTHLQHAPFTYRIKVENNGQQRSGTVRIFLAPKYDERGRNYLFRDQRLLFVELDKFTINLRSGSNTIERQSSDSSVTIPYDQTFRNQENRPTSGNAATSFNYCGCGWPQHMLIAKGNAEGMAAELFVMITDARNDTVQQPNTAVTNSTCDDAQSYCGLRGGLYPDRRAMGFPFDRMPRTGVTTLTQFLTSNMFVQNTVIRFTNRTVPSTRRTNTNTTSGTVNPNTTGGNTNQSNQSNQRPQQSQSGSGNRGQNTNTSNNRRNC